MPWLAASRCRWTRSVWPCRCVSLLIIAGLATCTAMRIGPSPAAALSPSADAKVTSRRAEILSELGASRWHRLGYRGRGVTVAILDTGFRGYRAHLGTTLPKQVTVKSFRQDGNLEAKDSQHGILCGEVIHAVAPECRLLFANWDSDRPDQFLKAARWARGERARVISCSLIMPSWSDGEGGGPVNKALAEIVGGGDRASDMLFCASAGNTASRHWSGRYREGATGFHEWDAGVADNALTPWGTDRVSVEMCWQTAAPSPPARLPRVRGRGEQDGRANTAAPSPPAPSPPARLPRVRGRGEQDGPANFEVSVVDGVTGQPVARSTGIGKKGKTGRSCAVARFLPREGKVYRVRVRLLSGKPCRFHLVALGAELSRSRARGSVSCPADGPAVVAVGAVDRAGRREWYSACGPNSMKPKPDFVAAVPFPSRWRARPFAGTSAAAPQAAALAALWWSRHPLWNAGRVRRAMQASAVDLGPVGHDDETGYGLVHLP
jgi:hypothetical protein